MSEDSSVTKKCDDCAWNGEWLASGSCQNPKYFIKYGQSIGFSNREVRMCSSACGIDAKGFEPK